MPRYHRFIQGWKKLTPGYARLVLPLVALMCHGDDRPPRQLQTVCARGYYRLFQDYLRPSEPLMLQVPHQTSVDARLRYWGPLLCPTEREVPSKTLDLDESVMLDFPWMTWTASATAEPVYLAFRPGCLQQKHSTPSRHEPTLLLSEWNPTHCATAERRTTPSQDTEIRSDLSTRAGNEQSAQYNGYKNETRALQRIAMLDHGTVVYGQTIEKSLPTLFALPTAAKPCANNVCGVPDNTARSLICPSPAAAWWARRQTAALHIPLTDLSHTIVPLLAGWMAAKMICGILLVCARITFLSLSSLL